MITEPIYSRRLYTSSIKPGFGARVVTESLHGWSPAAFERLAHQTDALIIDTRRPEAFKNGFVPNAINMGVDGNFAPWLGTLIKDTRQPILLVCDAGREREVAGKMARVGFDKCLGYLEGGVAGWVRSGRALAAIPSVNAGEVARFSKAGSTIIDVRKAGEFELEHLIGAINIPLERISERAASLDPDRTYYTYCLNGYRSAIFASMLRSRGFREVRDVNGGLMAMRKVSGLRLINDLKSVPIL